MKKDQLKFLVSGILFVLLVGYLIAYAVHEPRVVQQVAPVPAAGNLRMGQSVPPNDLAVKSEAGKAAMAAGRFDEAASVYAEIVKALPNEADVHLNLGLAHAMAGRPGEAIRHLEDALRLQPGLVPALLYLGAANMQLGKPAQAVAPLQKVVAAEPDNLQARQMLADALLARERWEPAGRRPFRELIEAAPNQAAAWYGLGRSYEGLARAALERLKRSAPESPYALLLAAETLFAQGRYPNAFRLYREALDKRPGLTEAHEALAVIYEKMGHADWATTERERARHASEPDCRVRTLECDFRAGRQEAVVAAAAAVPPARRSAEADYWLSRAAGDLARQAFARLEAQPSSPEAALVKAEVLRTQRQPVEAAAELRRAVEAWPTDFRLRRELASALYQAYDFAAARPALEELLKAEPESAELAYLLGDTLLQQREPQAAVPVLEKAVMRDPKRLPARSALGAAYAQAGEPARAIPHLLAAASTDEDGSLHYQLARAYQATGRADLATQALRKSQEIRQATETWAQSLEKDFEITPPH